LPVAQGVWKTYAKDSVAEKQIKKFFQKRAALDVASGVDINLAKVSLSYVDPTGAVSIANAAWFGTCEEAKIMGKMDDRIKKGTPLAANWKPRYQIKWEHGLGMENDPNTGHRRTWCERAFGDPDCSNSHAGYKTHTAKFGKPWWGTDVFKGSHTLVDGGLCLTLGQKNTIRREVKLYADKCDIQNRMQMWVFVDDAGNEVPPPFGDKSASTIIKHAYSGRCLFQSSTEFGVSPETPTPSALYVVEVKKCESGTAQHKFYFNGANLMPGTNAPHSDGNYFLTGSTSLDRQMDKYQKYNRRIGLHFWAPNLPKAQGGFDDWKNFMTAATGNPDKDKAKAMELATLVPKFKFYPQILDYICEEKNVCDIDTCATKADCSDMTIVDLGDLTNYKNPKNTDASSAIMEKTINVMLLAVLLTRLAIQNL
jgi:hypothetical protein